MKWGRITIKGSAGRNLGRYMSGGIITVQGDVLGRVGRGMSGGKICIEGGFEGVSKRIKGGKVYHNGEHVYPEAGAES
jgi:formylmethanofuran dehydrogenase subunit C